MIINIRGTSGSGKTTLVRGLFAASTGVVAIGDRANKPDAYSLTIPDLQRPVFVVGSYENTCGGCDTIKTQDEICNRVRALAPNGHVIFEGLLLSTLWSRYAALDREMTSQGYIYVWGFLNTPLSVCIERVKHRRDEAGRTDKPFDPSKTEAKFNQIRNVRSKCLRAFEKDWREECLKGLSPRALDARDIHYETAVGDVLDWLERAG